MKSLCAQLQDRMAEDGVVIVQDDVQAMDHVASCDDCSAVMHELESLEALLDDLPVVDAPDAVVEALMQRPELRQPPRTGFLSVAGEWLREWRSWRARSVWQPMGAAAALLLVTTVSWQLFTGGDLRLDQGAAVELQKMTVETATAAAPEGESTPMEEAEDVASSIVVDTDSDLQKTFDGRGLEERKRLETSLRALGYTGDGIDTKEQEQARPNVPLASSAKPSPPMQPEPAPGWRQDAVQEVYEEITVVGEAVPTISTSSTMSIVDQSASEDAAEMDSVFGYVSVAPAESAAEGAAPSIPGVGRRDVLYGAQEGLAATEVGDAEVGDGSVVVDSKDEAYRGLETAKKALADEPETPARRAEKAEERAHRPSDAPAARRFLEARDRTEGVAFQPATGYWRNTYVPGDSELRHLASRLGEADKLDENDGYRAPHELARTPRQPFDVPDNAALAVYLSADRQVVNGRRRMLVQVGLQGTERHGGRRGAMGLTVVLDLTDGDVDAETVQRMGALLTALVKAKEPGDQFRLVVAGHGGGEVLDAEDFRHGPLTLALQDAVEAARDTSLPWFSLGDAHRQAVLTASGAMDPEAPLGSSLVLIALSEWVRSIVRHEHIAHRGALEGVHTSVVSVGSDLDLEQLDRIALAGQGHRRLLHRLSDAEHIVDRELQSVSRVIARAVRLRIRLSPGVHLVDVLGSERLDTVAAQRVRDAESHADRQLSRQLGIAADRGEDEEGLQIVIPSFYAGDSHVVLLDVVTDGAGPIADVRVRYKDLVHLENGVSRARLDVPRGRDRGLGPLQRNVLENLMALELRSTLMEAADHVSVQEEVEAADLLERFEALLRGLGEHVPGWLGDRDVERDLRLLSEARRLLSGADGNPGDALQDSLRYSGYLKTLPPPEDGDPVHSEPPPQ